jgi:hypothetical protein
MAVVMALNLFGALATVALLISRSAKSERATVGKV